MSPFKKIVEAFESFRKCDYGVEYSDKAKRSHLETGTLLTADEHSKMSEIDFKDHFSSRERLIQWYFSYLSNMNKISILTEVGNYLKTQGESKVISFGSGPSVLEYFLKLMLGDKVKLLCTDYDSFIIDNAKRIFPEMEFAVFDFYAEEYEVLARFGADTALLLGSACSMDNARYIQFLKKLKSLGIRRVFCFEAATYGLVQWIYAIARNMVKQLLKGEEKGIHSFHAYRRAAYEAERIFSEAGFKYDRLKGHAYTYAYFLYAQ